VGAGATLKPTLTLPDAKSVSRSPVVRDSPGKRGRQIRVAIIIVSYNTKDLLLACLSSVLTSTTGVDSEIVVVDNGSVDGSSEAVQSQFRTFTLIRNSANAGFAAACNQGIQSTAAPLILLLNSDALISPEALEELARVMESAPSCGAAGCRVTGSTGVAAVNTRNFLNPFNQVVELIGLSSILPGPLLARSYQPTLNAGLLDCSVDWIDGACLMLRRAALDDVGLFDERFFMYSEDEDLCYRLRQKGWSICYTARASVQHRGGASATQDKFTNLRRFYESQLLFLVKYQGRRAARWYLDGMLLAAALKGILYSLLLEPKRKSELDERTRALKTAVSILDGDL
jgi:N-acetylglucosaminyl-diphospho-decaprenol L-rhamnosyltransferase